MSRAATFAPGDVIANRYVVVRALGAGAMGSVLEARPRAGGDHVAIKTLLGARAGVAATSASAVGDADADAAERRARFEREIAVCAKLDHPNLVAVIDHGIHAASATPFAVMPLLRGLDLADALRTAGDVAALEPSVAVPLFVQACEGIEAAHAVGIVHRDIKPSNLFLEEREPGAPLRVRVTDFGLAKTTGKGGRPDTALRAVHGELTGLTASGAFMGTAHYASPEQAVNAKHADARSDVWSVAMTLYHALSGAPAFARAGSFMAFLVKVSKGAGIPPLQDVAPWVSPHLARAIHGALVRDVAARCPSALELRLGIEAAVGWDVAHAPVVRGQLRAASAETRAPVAPRAALPRAWSDLLRG